jgi:hypothetical protein
VRDELLRRIAGRGEPVEVWLARGDPMSAGSAFALLGQALKRVAGLQDGEPIESRRKKLRARVGRHVGMARGASHERGTGRAYRRVLLVYRRGVAVHGHMRWVR